MLPPLVIAHQGADAGDANVLAKHLAGLGWPTSTLLLDPLLEAVDPALVEAELSVQASLLLLSPAEGLDAPDAGAGEGPPPQADAPRAEPPAVPPMPAARAPTAGGPTPTTAICDPAAWILVLSPASTRLVCLMRTVPNAVIVGVKVSTESAEYLELDGQWPSAPYIPVAPVPADPLSVCPLLTALVAIRAEQLDVEPHPNAESDAARLALVAAAETRLQEFLVDGHVMRMWRATLLALENLEAREVVLGQFARPLFRLVRGESFRPEVAAMLFRALAAPSASRERDAMFCAVADECDLLDSLHEHAEALERHPALPRVTFQLIARIAPHAIRTRRRILSSTDFVMLAVRLAGDKHALPVALSTLDTLLMHESQDSNKKLKGKLIMKLVSTPICTTNEVVSVALMNIVSRMGLLPMEAEACVKHAEAALEAFPDSRPVLLAAMRVLSSNADTAGSAGTEEDLCKFLTRLRDSPTDLAVCIDGLQAFIPKNASIGESRALWDLVLEILMEHKEHKGLVRAILGLIRYTSAAAGTAIMLHLLRSPVMADLQTFEVFLRVADAIQVVTSPLSGDGDKSKSPLVGDVGFADLLLSACSWHPNNAGVHKSVLDLVCEHVSCTAPKQAMPATRPADEDWDPILSSIVGQTLRVPVGAEIVGHIVEALPGMFDSRQESRLILAFLAVILTWKLEISSMWDPAFVLQVAFDVLRTFDPHSPIVGAAQMLCKFMMAPCIKMGMEYPTDPVHATALFLDALGNFEAANACLRRALLRVFTPCERPAKNPYCKKVRTLELVSSPRCLMSPNVTAIAAMQLKGRFAKNAEEEDLRVAIGFLRQMSVWPRRMIQLGQLDTTRDILLLLKERRREASPVFIIDAVHVLTHIINRRLCRQTLPEEPSAQVLVQLFTEVFVDREAESNDNGDLRRLRIAILAFFLRLQDFLLIGEESEWA
jgi:hypothetical protein